MFRGGGGYTFLDYIKDEYWKYSHLPYLRKSPMLTRVTIERALSSPDLKKQTLTSTENMINLAKLLNCDC